VFDNADDDGNDINDGGGDDDDGGNDDGGGSDGGGDDDGNDINDRGDDDGNDDGGGDDDGNDINDRGDDDGNEDGGGDEDGSTQCGPEFPRTLIQIIYGVSVCIIGYFLPLCILGYVYTKIFHSAKQSARRISRVSLTSSTRTKSFATHKQVAITVMILVVLFLSCWTPYFVYVIIIIAKPLLTTNRHILALGRASYWMAFLCSALNPYIYGARNPQFRKAFKQLICCVCLTYPLKFASSKESWEGLGGSNDSNSVHRYGFAYTPHGRLYMGNKRRRPPGRWRPRKFNEDSHFNAGFNDTSFSVRREVSFLDNHVLISPRNSYIGHDDELSDQRTRYHSNNSSVDSNDSLVLISPRNSYIGHDDELSGQRTRYHSNNSSVSSNDNLVLISPRNSYIGHDDELSGQRTRYHSNNSSVDSNDNLVLISPRNSYIGH
ncbi:hypothetical protein QZH41_016182, partial [Actinostola sp. cb2023]